MFSSELTGFEQGDSGVTAELRDMRSGGRQRVRAAYLVAADGANSGIRQQLGIAMNGQDHLGRELNILFRADLSQAIAGRRSVLYRIRNQHMTGIFRPVDSEGRWCMTTPWFADPSSERCLQMIRDGVGNPKLLAEIMSVQEWEMAASLADRFRAGRVFLVGDAAHRLTPFGAFGMNTAIQDSHNLAWKLAAVFQGRAGPGLLDTYEPERLPVARQNVEFSFIPDMMRGDVQRASRTLGYVLGFNYESSAIVPDGSGPVQAADPVADYVPSARPGQRAPHCWLQLDGRRVSTIDLFDRQLVLLSPSPSWAALAEQVAADLRLPLKSYVIDDLDWAQLYGVDSTGAVLVRPDGHVAWRQLRQGAAPATELRDASCQLFHLHQPYRHRHQPVGSERGQRGAWQRSRSLPRLQDAPAANLRQQFAPRLYFRPTTVSATGFWGRFLSCARGRKARHPAAIAFFN